MLIVRRGITFFPDSVSVEHFLSEKVISAVIGLLNTDHSDVTLWAAVLLLNLTLMAREWTRISSNKTVACSSFYSQESWTSGVVLVCCVGLMNWVIILLPYEGDLLRWQCLHRPLKCSFFHLFACDWLFFGQTSLRRYSSNVTSNEWFTLWRAQSRAKQAQSSQRLWSSLA